MSKCAFCKEIVPRDELVADHILPLSQGGGNGPENIQWVHRSCHRNKAKWYWRLWYKYLNWIESFEPCDKEKQGYRCKHATLSNGQKECGDE